MRTYMMYLLLTGKRLLRQLPYFLAGLAVMVLLVGMAAFSASKVLYGETSLNVAEQTSDILSPSAGQYHFPV